MPQPQQHQIQATSATYLQQRRILNLLNKARDWTHILMDTNQARYRWASEGTPRCTDLAKTEMFFFKEVTKEKPMHITSRSQLCSLLFFFSFFSYFRMSSVHVLWWQMFYFSLSSHVHGGSAAVTSGTWAQQQCLLVGLMEGPPRSRFVAKLISVGQSLYKGGRKCFGTVMQSVITLFFLGGGCT